MELKIQHMWKEGMSFHALQINKMITKLTNRTNSNDQCVT